MCRELYAHRDWLWTFLDHDGVEPTNNASERSLRHAVIWRKLSFGTQSDRGSRFVETMLSVIETCRQQKRNVFAFVTAAVESHFARRPVPLLLAGVRPVPLLLPLPTGAMTTRSGGLAPPITASLGSGAMG